MSQPDAGLVRVRRTGGFAGRTLEGVLDLGGGDPRATAARLLLDRIDLTAAAAVGPAARVPDAFSYTIEAGGRSVTLAQHELSDDQRALADLVLRGSAGA